jgi:hypothetical protein
MNERSGPDRKAYASEEGLPQHWAETRAALAKLPSLLATLRHAVTGTSKESLTLLTPVEVAEAIAKDPNLLKTVRDFLGPNGEGYTANKEAAGMYKELLSPLVLERSAKKATEKKGKK